MFDKNIFVINSNDKEVFDAELAKYKDWSYDYVKNNLGISYKKYSNDFEENFKNLNNLFIKYAYLSSVKKTEEVIEIYQHMITAYNDYSSPFSQDKNNFEFVKSVVAETDEEKYLLEKEIEGFEYSGMDLSEEKQKELNDLRQELSKSQILFNKNLVDSKNEWFYELTDDVKNTLSEKDLGYFKDVDGKMILKYNQNIMSDISVETLSEPLRKIVYDVSNYPGSPKSNFDNTEITKKILGLKHNIAKILGYENYSHITLKDRMAENYENVSKFLEKMKDTMRPIAIKEYDDLNSFMAKEYGLANVPKWNRAYYSNKKREKELNYIFNMERPYFKKDAVYEGVFKLVEKLFGFDFVKDTETFNLPYEDTDCFKVYENGVLKAYLIVDMYERELKNSGAWVSGLDAVTINNVGLVSLCCNINKKDIGMDIDEINTFLHEMGHAVHHFSSKVNYSSVAGTNGVARDAVEIPSQMLEQYAYSENFLYNISGHVETGEKIPKEMLNSIKASKNYNIASMYARQIVFATYDLNIYTKYDGDIFEYYKELANSILPAKVDEDTNFPNMFSHIFAGGYSAGYYGYMWADIYSIDAFINISENEIDNAKKFKDEFLAKGGSGKALEFYNNFRGETVNIDNFLKYYGV